MLHKYQLGYLYLAAVIFNFMVNFINTHLGTVGDLKGRMNHKVGVSYHILIIVFVVIITILSMIIVIP